MASEFHFCIDLPVQSEWRNVDLIRTSVENCFTAVFSDLDGCHALAMVTGELLENAVKYGRWLGDDRVFRLKVWGEGNEAHVSVENPVDPDDPNVTLVVDTLRWIQSFGSTIDAYRARLLQIAESRDGASRLGLVRVCYEGNCSLRAEVTPGVLRIIADMKI
jgi:hypothetical protein